MNKFQQFINNMRYKKIESIANGAPFAIGYYKKSDKMALLYDGKRIKNDIKWATKSMLQNMPHSNIIKLLAVMDNQGQITIFNDKGKNLTPNGLKISNLPMWENYGIRGHQSTQNEIVLNILCCPTGVNGTQAILYLDRQEISPEYDEVYSYNDFMQRKVKAKCGVYHYINEKGNPTSINFLSETKIDANGNKIFTTFNIYGDQAKVLVNQKNQTISSKYEDIILDKGGVYRCSLDKYYFYLTPTGKIITKSKSILGNSYVRQKANKLEDQDENLL